MKLKQFWMSTAVATLIAGGALAQDTAAPETGVVEGGAEAAILAPTFTSLEEMTVDDMIGMYVYDPEGNQISEIDYVISGVGGPEGVLGIGGFLGLGEYTVALPLSEFDLGEDGSSLRLNTDKETLKTYPEFDESSAESLPGETSIGALLAEADSTEPMSTEDSTVEVEEAMPEVDSTGAVDVTPEGDDMSDDMADDTADDMAEDTADDTATEETTTQ